MICNTCGKEKTLEEFGWRLKDKGVRKKRCKDCDKSYHDVYYLKNRDKEIKRSKRNTTKTRQRNRERLYKFFLTRHCVDCGISDPLVLEFDHVRGEKKRNVANMVLCGFSWHTILDEISKCEVRLRKLSSQKNRKTV